jgi:pyrroloquinoline quinone (PQQ) biosynthesis protein C
MMKPQEWRQQLGERVRDLFRSPEMEQFYSVPLTLNRARIYLLQLGLYVRQRRNFWPQVAANCPEFEVKQRIMEHEYEELVEDEFSKAGHLDLIFRQGKELGLSVDDVMKAEPLPTTKAAIYGWFWIARHRPWQEAVAASTIAEWINDDRLLGDLGGANSTRLNKIWKRDMNFSDAQMPNFTAHSKADVRHSDMFIDVLEKYVAPGREQDVIDTAKETMDLHRAYFGGMAQAMLKVQ